MIISKEQFVAWYLQAKDMGRYYCLVDMDKRLVRSKDWVDYYETYTINKTGNGIYYELVFERIWKRLTIEPLLNNPDNEFVVIDEISDKDFKGYDYYYYDENENLISLDVKHSTHPVMNFKYEFTEYGKSLINKARKEKAMYLYVFDVTGELLIIDVDNEKFINKIDVSIVSECMSEVKEELLSKQIFNQNLKFY